VAAEEADARAVPMGSRGGGRRWWEKTVRSRKEREKSQLRRDEKERGWPDSELLVRVEEGPRLVRGAIGRRGRVCLLDKAVGWGEGLI